MTISSVTAARVAATLKSWEKCMKNVLLNTMRRPSLIVKFNDGYRPLLGAVSRPGDQGRGGLRRWPLQSPLNFPKIGIVQSVRFCYAILLNIDCTREECGTVTFGL